jgi:hypothetical protein
MNPLKINPLKVLVCALSFFCLESITAQTNFNSNGIHFPLLKKKNDATISVGYLFGSDVTGLSFQSAYNIRNNVGVMFNFWNADKSVKNDSYKYKTNHQLEFGIGTGQEIGKLTMSIYTGYGFGKLSTDYINVNHYKVQFSRFFVQGALIRYSDDLYFGSSLRLNYLNFRNAEINVNYSNFYQVRALENNNPSIQPEIGGIFGFKSNKIFGDFSLTYFHRRVRDLSFSRVVVRLAIGYYLDPKTKMKKSKKSKKS